MGHLVDQQCVDQKCGILSICCIHYYKNLFGGILRALYGRWCILQDWLGLNSTSLTVEKGSSVLPTRLERYLKVSPRRIISWNLERWALKASVAR